MELSQRVMLPEENPKSGDSSEEDNKAYTKLSRIAGKYRKDEVFPKFRSA